MNDLTTRREESNSAVNRVDSIVRVNRAHDPCLNGAVKIIRLGDKMDTLNKGNVASLVASLRANRKTVRVAKAIGGVTRTIRDLDKDGEAHVFEFNIADYPVEFARIEKMVLALDNADLSDADREVLGRSILAVSDGAFAKFFSKINSSVYMANTKRTARGHVAISKDSKASTVSCWVDHPYGAKIADLAQDVLDRVDAE